MEIGINNKQITIMNRHLKIKKDKQKNKNKSTETF